MNIGATLRGGGWTVALGALLLGLTWAPATAAAAATAGLLSLDITPSDHVVCRGMVSFDEAGAGQQQLLYVAPSFAALLAEVATHSALVAGSKSAQKQKIQDQADQVLASYRTLLSDIRVDALLDRVRGFLDQRGLRLVGADTQGADTIRLAPVFFLTQDQRAFAVEAPIEVAARADGRSAWRSLVRVVGQPIDASDPAKSWQDHDGEALQREFSGLLVEAVAAALAAAEHPAIDEGADAHTFRYPEGGQERFERGTLVTANCERLTLRTLRGNLFSVPHARSSNYRPAECPAARANPGKG